MRTPYDINIYNIDRFGNEIKSNFVNFSQNIQISIDYFFIYDIISYVGYMQNSIYLSIDK